MKFTLTFENSSNKLGNKFNFNSASTTIDHYETTIESAVETSTYYYFVGTSLIVKIPDTFTKLSVSKVIINVQNYGITNAGSILGATNINTSNPSTEDLSIYNETINTLTIGKKVIP